MKAAARRAAARWRGGAWWGYDVVGVVLVALHGEGRDIVEVVLGEVEPFTGRAETW